MKYIFAPSGEIGIIDDIDFDLCNFKWHFNGKYLIREENGYSICLHKIIFFRMFPNETSEQIDHKDQNKLNCVRSNLRSCNQNQNKANSSKYSNNTTSYKGVSFNKKNRKFVAHIRYYGRRIHLGCFDLADQAAQAYNNASLRLFGEFASLNMIPRDSSCDLAAGVEPTNPSA